MVKEWLNTSPELFENITLLKPEYTYGKTRVDFYLSVIHEGFLLRSRAAPEIEGIGYFPDAPTERGVRHLYDLLKHQEDTNAISLLLFPYLVYGKLPNV